MFITPAAAQTAHTEAPAAPPKGAFPPFDASNFAPQLVWLALVFGILYLLMSRVALPRVAGILEARRNRISQDLDDAAGMQKQADAAAQAYEKTLADARAKAQSTAKAMRDQLAAESEAKSKALEAELNGKLAAAEAKIADTKAQAMGNVAGIAEEAASAIVKQLTGQSADAAAIAKAVASAKAS